MVIAPAGLSKPAIRQTPSLGEPRRAPSIPPPLPLEARHSQRPSAVPVKAPAEDSDNASIPPPPGGSSGDPFGQFEEELDGEATRIDTDDILAEQSTSIIEEAPEPPYLEVEAGKDLGKQFVLGPGDTAVGRGIDNDVILTDVAVSRRHLRIINDEGGLRIRDLGSGNGTLLNSERVFESPLVDGDRIELGETILVVRVPVRPTEGSPKGSSVASSKGAHHSPIPVPAHPAAPLPQHTGAPVLTATDVVPGVNTQGMTQWLPRPGSPEMAPGVIIPRAWLLSFMVVGGLLVALLGATVTALILRRDPAVPVSAESIGLDSVFEAGAGAYRAKRWDEAERAFGQVLATHPGDSRAMQYLQQIRDARDHEQLVASARDALQAGDARTALNKAASVPPSSPLSPEAEAIRLAARAKQVADHVAAANEAQGKGNLLEAKRRLAEARTLDPQSEAVRALSNELSSKKESDRATPDKTPDTASSNATAAKAAVESKPAAESKPSGEKKPGAVASAAEKPTTPSGGSADKKPKGDDAARPGKTNATSASSKFAAMEKRAMGAYRDGHFAEASAVARTAAASGSPEDRQRMTRLAESIDQFAAYYGRIKAAGSNVASVVRQMHTAITLDTQISGGHYGKQLKPPLVEAYLSAAKTVWDQGRVSTACQRVRQALAVDATSAGARDLASRCEKQAADMVKQAMTIEKADAAKARALYREVLTMVPQASPVHRQAYQRLNSVSRQVTTTSDEDEN